MSYVIKNYRTDEVMSPKFKTWKDADKYQHQNKDLKWDPQRHYFIIDQVKAPKKKKKSNKSKLKIA